MLLKNTMAVTWEILCRNWLRCKGRLLSLMILSHDAYTSSNWLTRYCSCWCRNSTAPLRIYRVVDYFKRIEFQHRGSSHGHILQWLDKDPREVISESMLSIVQLIEDLCFFGVRDLPSSYAYQVRYILFLWIMKFMLKWACRYAVVAFPQFNRYSRVLFVIKHFRAFLTDVQLWDSKSRRCDGMFPKFRFDAASMP